MMRRPASLTKEKAPARWPGPFLTGVRFTPLAGQLQIWKNLKIAILATHWLKFRKSVWAQMPRDGAIIFRDLAGKLGVLRTCEKCGQDRRYILAFLIRQRCRAVDGPVPR
jgi:hypothetical protein